MDLFEYQARDLFESHQIPVLAGAVATTPEEAHAAATKIGGKVVVKAQVKVGGRGKAGGVKLAENADDAKTKAAAILGMDIKGHTVNKVMIAQAAPIDSEYYLAILLDRANRNFLVMASITAALANFGGTKTTEAFAPVALIASATELKTGINFPSISTLWPPLPGVTPPTILVPALSMRFVCLVPSDPVMPWTITLVFSFTKIAIILPPTLQLLLPHHP